MKKARVWLTVGAIIITIVLIYTNRCNDKFWEASFGDVVNFAFVFFAAFLFSTSLENKRRKNDAIERIVLEILTNINDEDFFSTKPQSTTLQVSCGNKIEYLKNSKTPKIQDDVKYIEEQLEAIRNLHSNHVNTDLENVRKDFIQHQLKIMDKCNKIQMCLFDD